ncbi:unnamed protein product [Linum trigynum]|uniref:Uncharacterized protein n=1 Tax=Linum trigynum TaxID=586398 RepID=A0AAV2G652_9ROSI
MLKRQIGNVRTEGWFPPSKKLKLSRVSRGTVWRFKLPSLTEESEEYTSALFPIVVRETSPWCKGMKSDDFLQILVGLILFRITRKYGTMLEGGRRGFSLSLLEIPVRWETRRKPKPKKGKEVAPSAAESLTRYDTTPNKGQV